MIFAFWKSLGRQNDPAIYALILLLLAGLVASTGVSLLDKLKRRFRR